MTRERIVRTSIREDMIFISSIKVNNRSSDALLIVHWVINWKSFVDTSDQCFLRKQKNNRIHSDEISTDMGQLNRSYVQRCSVQKLPVNWWIPSGNSCEENRKFNRCNFGIDLRIKSSHRSALRNVNLSKFEQCICWRKISICSKSTSQFRIDIVRRYSNRLGRILRRSERDRHDKCWRFGVNLIVELNNHDRYVIVEEY